MSDNQEFKNTIYTYLVNLQKSENKVIPEKVLSNSLINVAMHSFLLFKIMFTVIIFIIVLFIHVWTSVCLMYNIRIIIVGFIILLVFLFVIICFMIISENIINPYSNSTYRYLQKGCRKYRKLKNIYSIAKKELKNYFPKNFDQKYKDEINIIVKIKDVFINFESERKLRIVLKTYFKGFEIIENENYNLDVFVI